MRVLILLMSTYLLASCAIYPKVPETLHERYRQFVQQSEMPLERRSRMYLGITMSNSLPRENLHKEIIIKSEKPNAVYSVMFNIDRLSGNIYEGRMWTKFDPLIVCITRQNLSRVGFFSAGIPIHQHGFNPSNQYIPIQLIPTPEEYSFNLENGKKQKASTTFSGECLTEIYHPFESHKD